MALNWNVKNVEHPPHLDESLDEYERDEATRTLELIIYGCMATGIGYIENEAEATEWHNRYSIWCLSRGYDVNRITLDQVKSYIGLETNVIPRVTRTKWDLQERKINGWK